MYTKTISVHAFLAIFSIAAFFTAIPCSAQTEKYLHSLYYNPPFLYDGERPEGGVIMDAAGNLYGTAQSGGTIGWGIVFELSPRASGGWSYQIIHNFNKNGHDGTLPISGLVMDAAGNLYGTTPTGGYSGVGTVFELSPTAGGGGWTEKILHAFRYPAVGSYPHDGYYPQASLILDSAGNLYGTTLSGGNGSNGGSVFELSPTSSGPWTETILWSFTTAQEGAEPIASVTFDTKGNLFGTTEAGGPNGYGTVFELSPSGSSWSLTTLYSFSNNGVDPQLPSAGVTLDAAGNIYGTGYIGGQFNDGVVFELSPSGSTWTETIVHAFDYASNFDGARPAANLVFDADGNLYGTTTMGGKSKLGISGLGTVFKLTPSSSGWTETIIHNFQGVDGQQPQAGVIFDAAGNMYGTTQQGGASGDGIVFEITP